MATNGRRIAVTVAALLSVVVAGASVAFACSQQARASLRGGQTSGPAGSRVTVEGTDFGPGVTEIRWNSGEKLGQATGSTFSVEVTIPNASPGVHYIVASEAVGTGTSSAAFEVTQADSPSKSTTNDLRSTGRTTGAATGSDESPSPAGTGGSSSASTQTTSNTSQPSTSGATQIQGPSQSDNVDSATPTPVQEGAVSNAPAPVSGTTGVAAQTASAPLAPTQPASANPPAVVAPSGQVVFGASVAPTATIEEAKSVASANTVSGDTWSGFGAPTRSSLLTGANPAISQSGAAGSAPTLGLSLLGSGLVALFAGFAVAETRRKRVLADAAGR